LRRDTSTILSTEAPASAALVRKPAQAVTGEALRVEAGTLGVRLHDLCGAVWREGTACTLPPFFTARNTGPLLISAAANHVCTASTGRSR
jgi:hypothetical protein